MPRMLHRPGAPANTSGRQRVFLATPAYRDVGANYAYALFNSSAALSKAGIAAELAIFAGDCHVDDARNLLVRTFLEGECTDLVFLDADLRWEVRDLVTLCQYDRDVVAATYMLKQDECGYPVRFIGSGADIWSDEDGLIEVEGVPTGFLRIRRHVLERLAEKAVKFHCKNDEGHQPIPLIFERQVEDGARWGGDYVFCRKWREAGGKVYVAPEMRIEHAGDKEWTGSLGAWLRRKNGLGLSAGLEAIGEARETPETFIELAEAWDNNWVAGIEPLIASTLLARETAGPILECGSGLTTLIMAAANPNSDIWVLEHNPIWASYMTELLRRHGFENVVISCGPLKDGWYVTPPNLPNHFSLILCDGPPRDDGDRAGLLRSSLTGDVYLFDDADDPAIRAIADQLAAHPSASMVVNGRAAIIHQPQEEKRHAAI